MLKISLNRMTLLRFLVMISSLSIILAMAFGFMTLTASAATVESGSCGASVNWIYSDDGTLTINGVGKMSDYSRGTAPWYSYRSSITRVVVGSGVVSIGNAAFYRLDSVSSVSLPDSLVEIGDYAFLSCLSLTDISIPDTVTKLGTECFSYCPLGSVSLPSSLVSIGVDCFSHCCLESIVIPAHVLTVASSAFSSNPDLMYVSILAESPPFCGSNVFSGSSVLTSIYVPSGTADAYKSAAGWSSYAGFITEGSYSGVDPDGKTDYVNSIRITCNSPDGIRPGKFIQFSAMVFGFGTYSSEVEWTLESGGVSSHTSLDEHGLLFIGEDEVKEYLTIRATSVQDSSIYADYTVFLEELGVSESDQLDDIQASINDVNTNVGSVQSSIYDVQDSIDGLSGDLQGSLGEVNDSIGAVNDSIGEVNEGIGELISGGEAGADLIDGSSQITDNVGQIDDFEQSQMDILDGSMADLKDTISFTSFISALSFVQHYIDLGFDGLGDFSVVLYLPLFLGLFFFICSRLPGVTRWSSPPKSGNKKG